MSTPPKNTNSQPAPKPSLELQPAAPTIWTIGGGKGGVGKSLISSNIGIGLAQRGHKTVLIDADLGGANLHTCLGVINPELGLTDFITRKVKKLEDVMMATPIPNLNLISGAQDMLTVANTRHAVKLRLIRAIQELPVEYVLVDLGAGTTFNTLDFFLIGHQRILVVIPEPTSIENAYRFIKSAFYRQIRQNCPNSRLKSIMDEALDPNKELGKKKPIELLDYLKAMDEEVAQFVAQQVNLFRPQLVLNQVRNRNDVRIGYAMDNACKKYFGIQLNFTGHVDFDDVVWQSVVQRKPLLVHYPQRLVSQKLRSLSESLSILGKPRHSAH